MLHFVIAFRMFCMDASVHTSYYHDTSVRVPITGYLTPTARHRSGGDKGTAI